MTEHLDPGALNPDAITLINACKELYESKNPGRIWEELPNDAKDFKIKKMRKHVSAYLTAAQPRTVETVAELDALPLGTVVIINGTMLQATDRDDYGTMWSRVCDIDAYPSDDLDLPARVLWMPTEGGGE